MKRFYALLMATLMVAVSFAHAGRQPALRPLSVQRVSQRTLAAKPVQRKAAKRQAPVVGADASSYVRVSTPPANWSGQYLIVYEEGSVAMNGGLTGKLDAVGNSVPVTIVDQEIEATAAMDAASFTISEDVMDEFTIKSQSGLYMGWETEGANGLASSEDDMYFHQLFIDSEGNAGIYASTGDAYLRYNSAENQLRFRYYKSATFGNQQPIALYKKGGEKTEPVGPQTGDFVEVPDDATYADYTMTGVMTLYAQDWVDYDINSTVQVAFDGTDIYIQGLSYWFPEAWVKGSVSGDRVLVPSNQLMGVDEYGDDYFVAYTNEEEYTAASALVFSLDAETGVMTMENWYGETDTPNNTGVYNYCEILTLTPGQAEEPEVVVVPEGLTLIQYNMTAEEIESEDEDDDDYYDYYEAEEWDDMDDGDDDWDDEEEDEAEEAVTFVAFDGADVYIQGLNPMLPKAWVKGTREGNTIVLPAGQYMGAYESIFGDFAMYFAGSSDALTLSDVRLTIAEDAKTITADNLIVINSVASMLAPYAIMANTVMTRVEEKAAMPEAPFVEYFEDYDEEYGLGYVELELPIVDVNGEPLAVQKYSYILYVDEKGTVSPYTFLAADYDALEEDITEVPYLLSDNEGIMSYGSHVYLYLYTPTQTYTRIGVQGIYRGGGVENKTEIVWYDIERDEDGIAATVAPERASQAFYTLSGQRVTRPTKGLYIQNGKKVLVK